MSRTPFIRASALGLAVLFQFGTVAHLQHLCSTGPYGAAGSSEVADHGGHAAHGGHAGHTSAAGASVAPAPSEDAPTSGEPTHSHGADCSFCCPMGATEIGRITVPSFAPGDLLLQPLAAPRVVALRVAALPFETLPNPPPLA